MGAAAATTDVLRDVETFAAGVYPGDEPGEVWMFTQGDLAEILANFRRLSTGPRPLHRIPVVTSHKGIQAYGWVTAARLKRGILFTDWGEVHPELTAAIQAGRFKKVSAEVKPDFMDRFGRHYGQYLYRVAVLGADVPRVKGLFDLPARFADPAPGRRSVRVFKFAEVRSMADAVATVDDKRKSVGDYYGLPQELIDSFSDDQVEIGATAILKDAAGGNGGAADAGGGAADTGAMADSATMTREELIAALTDLGEDPAALEAKTDDELRALYDQLTGGAAMSEKQGTQKKTAAAPAQTFADPTAVARVIDGAVRRGLAQINRATKTAEEAQRKKADADAARAKETRVRTFCEQMVKENRLTPADLDESDPRVLSELQKLLRLDDTQARTFSEGGKDHKTTDLEAAMEAIRRRKPRLFSERVPAGGQGGTESVSPDRRRELLGLTTLGRSILAAERKKN